MKVVYGSMGKSLHAGKAAMDGLLSGFLARDGFTSSTESIEGHRGFLHLFSPEPAPQRAVEGLGETWYLRATASSPTPAARSPTRLRRPFSSCGPSTA